MLICQRNTELQPDIDSHHEFDWTQAAQAYSNLNEMPSFLSQQQQSAAHHTFTTSADPSKLQGKQLQAYVIVREHMESQAVHPLRMVISGTAGTGKSYLIQCLRLLLQDQVCVAAPTGVAAFNVEGQTLHSLLSLPTKGEYHDLQGERLRNMQQTFKDKRYLIIDEMSMVGRKLLGQVDSRLRQVFPQQSDQLFGGCSCLLFGDFGQLPPVMDLPLYTTVSRNAMSDLGSTAYQMFDNAVVLEQPMRQSGQNAEQVLFRNILLRLRNGQTTTDDWKHLMKRTAAKVQDLTPFANALQLRPTVEAVVEHNITKLHASGQSIATIKAVHTGPNAIKASPDEASGLDPIICLAHGARVMLTANLWVPMGLVNGAMGTIKAVCYSNGNAPPQLPIAVMVRFDSYSGPVYSDGTFPITPIRRTWSTSGVQCSRLQLPLKLAWAVTIHKAQGLTLDKVVIDVGKKEFSSGLTFVATSRVRHLNDLLFDPPFPFQRLANLAKSQRLQERLQEDTRLLHNQIATSLQASASSPTSQVFTIPSLTITASPTSNNDRQTMTLSPTSDDDTLPWPVTLSPNCDDNRLSMTPSPTCHHDTISMTPSPTCDDNMILSPTGHDNRLSMTPSPTCHDDTLSMTPSPTFDDNRLSMTPSPTCDDDTLSMTPSPTCDHNMLSMTPSPTCDVDTLSMTPSPTCDDN